MGTMRVSFLSILFLHIVLASAQSGCIVTAVGPPRVVHGVPATAVRTNRPNSVASDGMGGFVFADTGNHVIRRVFPNGTISTAAGTSGSDGYAGDSGSATSARLRNPYGVIVDANGSLWIADTGNHVIRRVLPNGIITTVAGIGGLGGYAGDGGSAAAALLRNPYGVAMHVDGSLWIADTGNQAIRRVYPNGIIVTAAGGSWGYSGDGGPATSAQLANPYGVAVDANGSLWIADASNQAIRRMNPNGTIVTVAGVGGGGNWGYTGDGGPATSARLNGPSGVAVHVDGSLWIADRGNHAIRRVYVNGTIVTAVGAACGNSGYSGDGGPATSARLNAPWGVAANANGSLWIADAGNHAIRHVQANGVIDTAAGIGGSSTTDVGYAGDGGPATSAQLSSPSRIAVDANGSLWIVDRGNEAIRRVYANGTIITVAGIGSSGYAGDGGPATAARLRNPWGVAVNANGSLWIADAGNHAIRHVLPNGTIITVAGVGGSSGYAGDGGPATAARLSNPLGIAVDANGSLWIADWVNHAIRRVYHNGTIATVAGSSSGYAGDGGPATSARLYGPAGVFVDANGSLWIADSNNNAIRRVFPYGTIITVAGVGGSGNAGYSGDGGPATSARLKSPFGVVVDAYGSLWIADTGNHAIRRVFPNGTIFTAVGIGGNIGYAGDGGPPTFAKLSGPTEVAVDANGSLWITDAGNHVIRRVLPPSVCALGVDVVCNSSSPSAAKVTCSFTNLVPAPPLYVWLADTPCTAVTELTAAYGGLAVVVCVKPPNRASPAPLQWLNQFGPASRLLNTPPDISATAMDNQLVGLGHFLSIRLNSPALPFLIVARTAITTMLQANVAVPCFNASMTNIDTDNNFASLTCQLLLWSDTFYGRQMALQLEFSTLWTVRTVEVFLPTSLNFSRPHLQLATVDLIPPANNYATFANLPLPAPSSIWEESELVLVPVCACNGTQSSLRGWFGAAASPRCSWKNSTTVACISPPFAAVGDMAARLTVEVCCLYNVTSDGAAPTQGRREASVDGLVLYDPSPAFSSWQTNYGKHFLSQLPNYTVSFSVSIPPALSSSLLMVIDAVYVAGVVCHSNWSDHPWVLTCANWSRPDHLLHFLQPLDGTLALPLSFRIRGQLITVPYNVTAALVPVVTSIFPPFATPGGCVAVLGDWLAGDSPANVSVSLGSESLACTNISRVSQSALSCCVPLDVPVSTPGFPRLRVTVSNNRGSSAEAIAITIPAAVGVTFTESLTIRSVMPALPLPVGLSHVFSVFPALVVRVSGSQQATCTVAIAEAFCPQQSAAPPSLVGSTASSTRLDTGAPYAEIEFADIGITAPMSCRVNLSVICVDGLGRRAVTPSTVEVVLGHVRLAWNTSAIPTAIIATPAARAPLIAATLIPDAMALAALGGWPSTSVLTTLFSCRAAVLPGDSGSSLSPGLNSESFPPLASVIGLLALSPCSLEFDALEGNVHVLCSNLTLPRMTPMGSRYGCHVQCTYVSGLDILTLGHLPMEITFATATLSAGSGSLLWEAYQPVLLTGNLSLTHAGSCLTSTSGATVQCSSMSFASAMSTCSIKLLAPSPSTAVALDSDTATATFQVQTDGSLSPGIIPVVVEGPPGGSGSIQLSCVLWDTQVVESRRVPFVLAPFITVFRFPVPLPLLVLPSAPSIADFPLHPSIVIHSSARNSLDCSLAVDATRSLCPTTGFQTYGVGFVDAVLPPRVVGSDASVSIAIVPSNATSIEVTCPPMGISAAGGCNVALIATCRDGIPRSNSTAVPVYVQIPRLYGTWNVSAAQVAQLSMFAPVELPPLDFSMFTEPAVPGLPSAAFLASWSCDVLLAPALAALPPLTPLSRQTRHAISVGAFLGLRINGTTAQMQAVGIDAAVAQLGAQLEVHMECTWTPTGERLRLPPLPVSIPTLVLTVVDAARTGTLLSHVITTSGADIPVFVRVAWLHSDSGDANAGGTADSALLALPPMQCNWVTLSRSSTAISLDFVGQETTASASIARNSSTIFALRPIRITSIGSSPSLTAALQCDVWSHTVRSSPITLITASMAIVPLSPLPSRYIPSDTGARWLLPEVVRVGVQIGDNHGSNSAGVAFIKDTAIRCSLSVINLATNDEAGQQPLLISNDAGTPLSAYSGVPADANGTVSFPRFGLRADFEQESLNLSVSCVSPNGDGPPVLMWSISAIPLGFRLCSPQQRFAQTSEPMHVQATLAESCEPTASTPTAFDFQPPPVTCTIQTLNVATIVQGGRASADMRSGVISFNAVAVTAPPGEMYELILSCSIGSIALSPTTGISFQVTLTGCPPGRRVFNSFCQSCEPLHYSLGGSVGECTACPEQGVSCANGVLSPEPNYYRPHRLWGAPLDGTSKLHPCFNGEACLVNATTLDYRCMEGYKGPLCGVCDMTADYARMGDACRPCGDRKTQLGLLVVLSLVVTAALSHVALKRNDGRRTDASIVLKIGMSYLQAVGSLRAFRAGGTKAYHQVMGWTDVVSANPLSISSIQCIWQPPFLAQYIVTVMLPLLASLAVIAIFLLATLARAVDWRAALTCIRQRSGMSSTQVVGPTAGCQCCKLRFYRRGCTCFRADAFYGPLQAWIEQRRHIATLVFVLFVAYMSITSASLRVFDCYQPPIDGITYLRSDLSVECHVGQHAAGVVIASVTLLLVGIGFPVGLFVRLAKASEEQLSEERFHSAWGFLYDGYRAADGSNRVSPELSVSGPAGTAAATESSPREINALNDTAPHLQRSLFHQPANIYPKLLSNSDPRGAVIPRTKWQRILTCIDLKAGHLKWWEALVLVRKAGIVLLAVLVTNPYFQTAGAAIWLVTFLCLHLHFQPYASPLFNGLETLSLAAAALTTIIAGSLLQFDVDDPAFKTKPPASMTQIEWAVTGALAAVNLFTFAAIISAWFFFHCRRLGRATKALRQTHRLSFHRNRSSTTKSAPQHTTLVEVPASNGTNLSDAEVVRNPLDLPGFQQSNPLRTLRSVGPIKSVLSLYQPHQQSTTQLGAHIHTATTQLHTSGPVAIQFEPMCVNPLASAPSRGRSRANVQHRALVGSSASMNLQSALSPVSDIAEAKTQLPIVQRDCAARPYAASKPLK